MIRQLRLDGEKINGYVLPDNKLVVPDCFTNVAYVWDLNTFEIKAQIQQFGIFSCFAPLSNGRIAVVNEEDLVILSLEGYNLSIVHQFEKAHDKEILFLHELPEGLCASVADDMSIKIWNCESFNLVQILTGHQGSIFNVKCVGDSRLVSCSRDRTIRLWNYETGECLQVSNGLYDELYFIENKYICGMCIDNSGENDVDDVNGNGLGWFLKLHDKKNLDKFQVIYYEKLFNQKGKDYFNTIDLFYFGDRRFAISYVEENKVKIFDFKGNRGQTIGAKSS
jgi:WD40 repeat protein